MNIPILGNLWVDLIVLAILFVLLNRVIQHFFSNPKEYFFIKRKNKEIQAQMKELMAKNDYIAVQEKQKEAFNLMSRQFKSMFKTMLPLLLSSLPVLYVVNTFYREHLFINTTIPWTIKIYGFWTFFIITFVLSIIANNLYDKLFEKKYQDYVPEDYAKK